MIKRYLQRLTAAHPQISEVWLLGSRANGTARDESDWDLLVFADGDTLRALSADHSFDWPGVDLLVVHDGDNFRSPWSEDGRIKAGGLSGWQWKVLGGAAATYLGTKANEGRDFEVITSTNKAYRLWPCNG